MKASDGFGLRPRTIGELVDLSFQIYRRGFRSFAPIGIAVSLLNLAMALGTQALLIGNRLNALAGARGANPDAFLENLVWIYASSGIVMLGSLLFYSVGAVAVTVIAEQTLFGRTMTSDDALRRSVGRLPAAIGAGLMFGLCTGAAAMACCLPAVPAAVVLMLMLPLVWLERLGPFAALSRSFQLTLDRGPRGLTTETNWVRVLVVGLLTLVVLQVLYMAANLPALIVGGVAGLRGTPYTPTALGPQYLPLWIMVPMQVCSACIAGIFFPLGVIPWTLVYYDIRTRHEGLDLELETRELGEESVAP